MHDRAAAAARAPAEPSIRRSADSTSSSGEGAASAISSPDANRRNNRCLRALPRCSSRAWLSATDTSHARTIIRHRTSPIEANERLLRYVGRQPRIAEVPVDDPEQLRESRRERRAKFRIEGDRGGQVNGRAFQGSYRVLCERLLLCDEVVSSAIDGPPCDEHAVAARRMGSARACSFVTTSAQVMP